jgi:hypothetical protein
VFTRADSRSREHSGARGIYAGPVDRREISLCSEHRRYPPSEVFQGRLSHLLKERKKPALEASKRITIWELRGPAKWVAGRQQNFSVSV